jgi:hypothetical protein
VNQSGDDGAASVDLKRHYPTLFDAPPPVPAASSGVENGPQTLPGHESVNAISLRVKARQRLMVSRR